MRNMKNSKLYDYFIHYNPFQGKWFAVLRDDAANYMNGKSVKTKFSAKKINKLIKKIKNGKRCSNI